MPGDPTITRPTICLTMIVRDEAHIIHEALDSAAAHIDRWVIVDTGSTDDTIAVVQRLMDGHGIDGEVHRRAWRDFGANRTEAMQIANGQADYLWVLDADDLVTGALDLTRLVADSYLLRYRRGHVFWRRQVFRSGLPWRYEGVLHEYPTCDAPATEERLDGAYAIHGRTLGARSADPGKYRRDATLLQAVLERDPDDLRALFYLGQSLADAGDDTGAIDAFERRAAGDGWDEERCLALLRRGDCLRNLGRPWEESLASYLAAAEARPTRAEPFVRIARHYRESGEYQLGLDYARRAAAMPYPEADNLFIDTGVYEWAARDEQAVCAYHVGLHQEALDLCTALLAGTVLPEEQRERVASNRDSSVGLVREARASRPPEIVARLTARPGSHSLTGDVTVSLLLDGDIEQVDRTLGSLLNCCEDLDRIARFVCVLDPDDRGHGRAVLARYPFLELIRADPASGGRLAATMNLLLSTVTTPLWMHLTTPWELFARSPFVERAARILACDETIGQVAFNRSFATTIEERGLVGGEVRTAGDWRFRLHHHLPPGGQEWARFKAALPPGAMTNVHWPHFTLQPSVIDVARIRAVGPFADVEDPERELATRYAALGLRTAFFDDVTCCLAPARASGPPLLSELIAGARAGELWLDLDPPARVASASVAPAGAGVRLIVRTEPDGLDHEVVLGAELDVESLAPATTPEPVVGPFETMFAGGLLRVDQESTGLTRISLRHDGALVGASVPFSLAGAEDERVFGIARLGSRLLIVFGVGEERLAVGLADEAAVRAMLEL
jgi:glycosyltransferase involved in cell wall biosynthesis